MNDDQEKLLCIERALTELDAFFGTQVVDRKEIPFYGPTRLASMCEVDQAMAVSSEQAHYAADPTDSAIHFCLSAAVALLEVSQALLNKAAQRSPQERERQLKTLVAYTKTAGRSAYRAATILTDRKS